MKQSLFLFLFILLNGFIWADENDIKLDPKLWQKAKKIHAQAIVIDTHCDTPMTMMEKEFNLGEKQTDTDVDLIRMAEGGVDGMFFAVYTPHEFDQLNPGKKALEVMDRVYGQILSHPRLAELAFSTKDIYRIHPLGKRAILLGLENGSPVENNLSMLRTFYRLGVRYITLTHSQNNDICDSSGSDNPRWQGLSPFGKEMVKEMNRIGMIIDVSHISDKAFEDVLSLSEAPVMASHSCVRAICPAPRNMTDEMIRVLAKKGGVIQINFYAGFLDAAFSDQADKIHQQIRQETKDKNLSRQEYWEFYTKKWKESAPPPIQIDVLINHIDHVVKLVGPDFVGLGSDFDGAGSFPEGLENVSGYPLITYHLLKRGYKEDDIKKILGGNFLRLMKEVEKQKKVIISPFFQ